MDIVKIKTLMNLLFEYCILYVVFCGLQVNHLTANYQIQIEFACFSSVSIRCAMIGGNMHSNGKRISLIFIINLLMR